jgi:uncharacterized protein (TIGR02145 family)
MAYLQYNNQYLQVAGQNAIIPGIAIDIDGNIYTSVVIGTQEWMVENLRTTRYRDGTPIPTGLTNLQWAAENGTLGHDGSFSWPNNDIANKIPYGACYNSYVCQNSHGLAIDGWSIPGALDIYYLINEVGLTVAKLKEVGTVHWQSPNVGATNESGFTAIPTGNRHLDGAHIPVNKTVGVYCTKSPSYYFPHFFHYYIFQNQDTEYREEDEDGRMGVAVRLMRYLPTEVSKERIDSRWCAINALDVVWNDNDGGITPDGTKLIFDGSGYYFSNAITHCFAFPSKLHVTISVIVTSGSLIPLFDGITAPMLITASGTYEYDLDYSAGVSFNYGAYFITNSFIGQITALSAIGKFE